jgi:DNA-binding transcriptional ArsR family regulator
MYDGDSDWHRTERALTHPDRAAILDHLAGVDLASGGQIAEAVGLAPATSAYHLRVLHDADLVERVGTMWDRGRAQSFYAAAG